MFRIGIVEQLDAPNCRAEVRFPARDQMISYWLPVVTRGSQNNKDYWMPDVGEQVVCLMDEFDEDGAILGAIYSSVDTPPVTSSDKAHFQFKDGATFEYDRAAHKLNISLPTGGTASITIGGVTFTVDATNGGGLTIDAPNGISLTSQGTNYLTINKNQNGEIHINPTALNP